MERDGLRNWETCRSVSSFCLEFLLFCLSFEASLLSFVRRPILLITFQMKTGFVTFGLRLEQRRINTIIFVLCVDATKHIHHLTFRNSCDISAWENTPRNSIIVSLLDVSIDVLKKKNKTNRGHKKKLKTTETQAVRRTHWRKW